MKLNCEVCGMSRGWVWTDTHGVGQCVTCGTPYRMYHYDDNHNRVDRPPLMCVKAEHVDLVRRYWRETGAKMPSGHSLAGREVASPQEIEQFMDWWNAQMCRHNERLSTRSGHVSKQST